MANPVDTQQQQIVETTAALGGAATFTSTARDCETLRAFGVSVLLTRDGGNTNVSIIVEHSSDNITFRELEKVNVVINPATTPVNFNRVYQTTRRFARVKLVNNTGNALAATEVLTMRKPF